MEQYVGDHFIRAMAILSRRDIVVLYEPGLGCKPGAKIFYANPTWFVTKSSSCLNKPDTIYSGIYDSVTDWDAFVAWFETGKPLPRRDDARICPPRTYTGHPFVITHNGASGGAAHYNSTAPLFPAASPPVSPDGAFSSPLASPCDAAVSAAPANIACLDSRPCDAAFLVAAIAAPAAQPAPLLAPRRTGRHMASRALGDSNLTVYRRPPRLDDAGGEAAGATTAAAAPATSGPADNASTPQPPTSEPAPSPAFVQQTAQPQVPVVLSQPDVLLPRLPHGVWVAIRDGGIVAAKEAAAKANATIDTVIAAAVGSCAKSLRGNASFTGLACCLCSKKFKEAPHLKNHLKLKPDCNHTLLRSARSLRMHTPSRHRRLRLPHPPLRP